MPETIYLLDGYALAYRTYFALTGANASRWVTSQGEPTAGVFGFASVLLRLLEQEQPDYLAVAFDIGKTFRDEMYPDYKATREKMPDDLRVQIERIRQLVDSFNIPKLEKEGYEADDVLGSAARVARQAGLGVKIITGDRDLLQLVDPRVIVSLPGRKLSDAQDYTEETVMEVLGVRPDQVVDYKALCGDTSDNIPGVYGIGKKTAEKLLAEYQTLEGIYDNLDQLAAGQRSKLETDRENAFMSQKLAQIVTDLDIPIDLEKANVKNFDPQMVEDLFREMEFRSLMPRLKAVAELLGLLESPAANMVAGRQMSMFPLGGSAPAKTGLETIVVDTEEKLKDLTAKLAKAKLISFDTETTSTDKMQAELVGLSLSVEPGTGYYLPVGHTQGTQLPLDVVLDALRPSLTDPKIKKAGHNVKYDYVMLARYGILVSPIGFDTILAEWLRDPASRNLGLKKLAWVRLGFDMQEIKELIGTGKSQITMAEVSIEQAAAYAVSDAEVLLRLIPELKKDLADVAGEDLFHNMELPLIGVLSEMEMEGIDLDTDFLKEMSVELVARMNQLTS
jgi:DNA polymerase-1